MEHIIASVDENSIGEEMGIEPGDVLVSVNGEEIKDVFDYEQMIADSDILVLIRKKNGEEWELEIEKDPDEDMGLQFDSDLMSDYIRCQNGCIFCFIDQMPKNMRNTLYFKDDDSRLSFLQGNYVTLTNMKEEDVKRIIRYRMEPINISVHTTNSELRIKMLRNKNAGTSLKFLKDFYDNQIQMNAQIVLCKNWNDGEELERTLRDLYEYVPVLSSLSVVPVGLTRYRENLEELLPIEKEDAEKVIETVEKWQKKAMKEFGIHYVHASDEMYLLAGREIPGDDTYDGYIQFENGVGMIRLLMEDAERAIREPLPEDAEKIKNEKTRRYSFATGELAYDSLSKVREMVSAKFSNVESQIFKIENKFFGPRVTVAGLLTGQDIYEQLKDKDLGDGLFLPSCMFRSGEEVFLDDMSRKDLEEKLHVPVVIIRPDGDALVHVMKGQWTVDDVDITHGEYELPKI